MTFEVQTRTEDGGLSFFKSINEAMNKAKDDLSIWKISFGITETGERVRLTRSDVRPEVWVYDPSDIRVEE